MNEERLHYLDALRAFAMLLGIVLHGLLSFVDIPIWPAQDLYQNQQIFGLLQHAIHGFRLPLFFLLSGFFTMMLWKRRGARALAKHRAIRILIPLVVGTFVTWLLIIPVGIWGQNKRAALQNSENRTFTVCSAAREGDISQMKRLIEDGGAINESDEMRMTPLQWAVVMGHSEVVRTLLEKGASIDHQHRDGGTALHSAAFFHHVEVVGILLENGADPNKENASGETALDSAKAPRWLRQAMGDQFKVPPVKGHREKTVELLVSKNGKPGSKKNKEWRDAVGIYSIGALIPIFYHLWFLYYLVWFVAVFLVLALIFKKWNRGTFWNGFVASRYRLFWLIPFTFLPQAMNTQTFGPDTAMGLLPWPPTVSYYGFFFFFGVLSFGVNKFWDEVGKLWHVQLVLAIPLLIVGVDATKNGDTLLSSACASGYVWLLIAACIGLFRRFFSSGKLWIRYISDSSYWLYITHLIPVIALQIWVSDWDVSVFLKFAIVCVVPTALLLLVYEFAVRYTFIGAVLNGRKVRNRQTES